MAETEKIMVSRFGFTVEITAPAPMNTKEQAYRLANVLADHGCGGKILAPGGRQVAAFGAGIHHSTCAPPGWEPDQGLIEVEVLKEEG